MSSLWTDLLLLHGHIHDPALVRRLASTPSTPPPKRPGGKREGIRLPLAAVAGRLAAGKSVPGMGRVHLRTSGR